LAFIPLYDTNPLRNIRGPWVAWSIIAANVLIYFVFEHGGFSTEPTNGSAISFGLFPAYLIGDIPRSMDLFAVPDSLTLVTYAFLHGSFWHLAGNMIFLWVFADNVEDALGHFRYFVFYFLCAAASGYIFVLSDPISEAPVIGASGAVAGNIAAYVLLYPRAKVRILLFFLLPVRLRVEYILGFWIAFQLYSAFAGGDAEIAWWAHLGGLLVGAILVVFMRQKGVPLFAKALPETQPSPDETPPDRTDESRGPW
jgi:membrane associated rhomboid family serine protease